MPRQKLEKKINTQQQLPLPETTREMKLRWILKPGLTPDEASLIITGFSMFKTIDEADTAIDKLAAAAGMIFCFQLILKSNDKNPRFASEWPDLLKKTQRFTAKARERLNNANIDKLKRQLKEAVEIADALRYELTLSPGLKATLEKFDPSKDLMTQESICNWCKSKGFDLTSWHNVFPSDNEQNEPEKLSRNGAEANQVRPITTPDKEQTHGKSDQISVTINYGEKDKGDLFDAMAKEMEKAEKGQPPTAKELRKSIVAVESYNISFAGNGSYDLKLASGQIVNDRDYKRRYNRYFTIK